VVAAFSNIQTPENVKIRPLSLRYGFLKQVLSKKVPVKWRKALSIIKNIADN